MINKPIKHYKPNSNLLSYLVWGIALGLALTVIACGGEQNVELSAHPSVKGTHDLESFVMNNCDAETQKIWKQVAWYAEYQGIDPATPFVISWADTSCGKNMTTANNPGNVGNTDSGARRGFSNMFKGWIAIVDTLNNSQMGGIDLIGHCSQGGRNNMTVKFSCHGAPAPHKCYATSEENWNYNVLNALNNIYPDKSIDENWNFRIQ